MLKASSKSVILVVDDDQGMRFALHDRLGAWGYQVLESQSCPDALEILHRSGVDLVLLDLTFQGREEGGMEMIPEVMTKWPDMKVIVVSAHRQSQSIRKALNLGAADYIVKDELDYDQLKDQIERALESKRRKGKVQAQIDDMGGVTFGPGTLMIGGSRQMLEVYELIHQVAQRTSLVLILGESGTGKELVARAIHASRGLPGRLFVSVNCGAVPKSVIESELFGVVANYPGFHNKEALIGKLELAGDGTLLLDEIANMDLDLQGVLLRVLEERAFTPLGASTPVQMRCQVLASTNVNLETALRENTFRRDLFYRLNEIPIFVPPLRERIEDVPLLVHHWLRDDEVRTKRHIRILPETMMKLEAYDWPGNCRELMKVMTRTIALEEAQYLTPENFDLNSSVNKGAATYINTLPVDAIPLKSFIKKARRDYAQLVLSNADGDRTEASQILRVDERTLRRILNGKENDESVL